MPFNDIQEFADKAEWKQIPSGQYNKVFISTERFTMGNHTGRWIKKIPRINSNHLLTQATNAIDRAIRKWNILNPKYPAYKTSDGWMVPFFGNQLTLSDQLTNNVILASDLEVAAKVISIYQQTGEIIADAYVIDNFLVYENEVICIDVDFMFRRGSFVSDEWIHTENVLEDIRNISDKNREVTHAVILTLFYLTHHLSAHAFDHASTTPRLIELLHAFRLQNKPITQDTIRILLTIEQIDPSIELHHRYLTPTFINALIKTAPDSLGQAELTKERIIDLFHEQLTDLSYVWNLPDQEIVNAMSFITYPRWALINKVGQSGYTLLHVAVLCNNNKLIRHLLDAGADPNTRSANTNSEHGGISYPNMTAMDIAICSPHEVSPILIEKGAQISLDKTGLLSNEQLDSAKRQNDYSLDVLKKLIKQLRQELLAIATNKNKLTANKKVERLSPFMIQHAYLFTWALDEQGSTFLHHVFATNHTDMIQMLISHPQWTALSNIRNLMSNSTLLHDVAINGHHALITHLHALDINAVSKYSHHSALHYAAMGSSAYFCQLLLQHGADPSLQNIHGHTAEMLWANHKKMNPLTQFRHELREYATKTNNLTESKKTELWSLMMQNMHLLMWPLQNNGDTFLHLVFATNHTEIIEILIKHSQWIALSQVKNAFSHTLLHKIVIEGHHSLFAHMHAIDINAMSHCSRNSALHYAAQKGNAVFCQLLLENGADQSLQNNEAKTAEEYWDITQSTNPFKEYRQEQEKKTWRAAGENGSPSSLKHSVFFSLAHHVYNKDVDDATPSPTTK